MSHPLIIVTGKNGQLGWEIDRLANDQSIPFDFLFAGRHELDLSDPSTIAPFFEKHRPAYFINCAAYTTVDKAETEKELAYTINAEAVGIIADCCKKYHTVLIQISTDYVFNGKGTAPYLPSTPTDPVNYYGFTKLKAEELAIQNNPSTIIIRTSWVYSTHGNNFVKTMLRLMKERPEIKVVDDQVGCPTYAADLAAAILQMITVLESGNQHFGIYQFSNSGQISWFQFAESIREEAGFTCRVLPIPSEAYPTPAKRPAFSVMDIQGLVKDFGISLVPWRNSLQQCLQLLG